MFNFHNNSLVIDTNTASIDQIDVDMLIPGDLILFINHYYADGATIDTPKSERYDPEREPHFDHTAMYAGRNKDNFHSYYHAAYSDDRTDIKKPFGLSYSTLMPLLNQAEIENNEDGSTTTHRYDVSFKIVRCLNQEISKKALSYLREWINHRIPYDEQRLQEYLHKEEDYTPQRFLDEALKSYHDGPGKYRAAKFCARRNTALTMPAKEGHPGRGITCAMLIVLAYQVAEMEHLITAIDPFATNTWVSDKYGVRSKESSENFVKYLNQLSSKNKAAITSRDHSSSSSSTEQNNIKWKTSDSCWKNAEAVENFTHITFPVDAKIITTAAINLYTSQHKNHTWQQKGELVLQRPVFSPEHKKNYHNQRYSHVFKSAFSSGDLTELGFTSRGKDIPPPNRSSSPPLNFNCSHNNNQKKTGSMSISTNKERLLTSSKKENKIPKVTKSADQKFFTNRSKLALNTAQSIVSAKNGAQPKLVPWK